MPDFRAAGVQILYQTVQPTAAHTGTTAETTLFTRAIPILGLNDILQPIIHYSVTNNANAKTVQIRYGGVAFYSSTSTSIASAVAAPWIAVRSLTAPQMWRLHTNQGAYSTSGTASAAETVDPTVGQNLIVTATLANAADSVIIERVSLLLFRAP